MAEVQISLLQHLLRFLHICSSLLLADEWRHEAGKIFCTQQWRAFHGVTVDIKTGGRRLRERNRRQDEPNYGYPHRSKKTTRHQFPKFSYFTSS